jgi:hypothetical protein
VQQGIANGERDASGVRLSGLRPPHFQLVPMVARDFALPEM